MIAGRAVERLQQREVLRGYVIAMTQRDELYEAFSGMRRGEPMFDAARESIGSIYRDPVVLDWMIDQSVMLASACLGAQRELGKR